MKVAILSSLLESFSLLCWYGRFGATVKREFREKVLAVPDRLPFLNPLNIIFELEINVDRKRKERTFA